MGLSSEGKTARVVSRIVSHPDVISDTFHDLKVPWFQQ